MIAFRLRLVVRILLAAGLGAGIGSIFRAPLAGALFGALGGLDLVVVLLQQRAEHEPDVFFIVDN